MGVSGSAALPARLVLSRGYAIVIAENGAIVRVAAGAPSGTDVKLMFARDAVRATVTVSPDIAQE